MPALPTGAEAVVFDCDGPPVDTEPCWTAAEAAIFAAHGCPFGPGQKALLIGGTLESAGKQWPATSDAPEPEPELAAELLEHVRCLPAVDGGLRAMRGLPWRR